MLNIFVGLCAPRDGWKSCKSSVVAVVQSAGMIFEASDLNCWRNWVRCNFSGPTKKETCSLISCRRRYKNTMLIRWNSFESFLYFRPCTNWFSINCYCQIVFTSMSTCIWPQKVRACRIHTPNSFQKRLLGVERIIERPGVWPNGIPNTWPNTPYPLWNIGNKWIQHDPLQRGQVWLQ